MSCARPARAASMAWAWWVNRRVTPRADRAARTGGDSGAAGSLYLAARAGICSVCTICAEHITWVMHCNNSHCCHCCHDSSLTTNLLVVTWSLYHDTVRRWARKASGGRGVVSRQGSWRRCSCGGRGSALRLRPRPAHAPLS